MITCQVELLANCLGELKALLPLHYDMLSMHKAEGIPLVPQYESYLRDERAGVCSAMVMRAEGRIVGYWIHYVAPGKHYATCLTSIMDIFFVHPEFRTGSAALRLLRAVELENRRRGVRLWTAGEKLHAPVGRLFEACGFSPIERMWAKWLG